MKNILAFLKATYEAAEKLHFSRIFHDLVSSQNCRLIGAIIDSHLSKVGLEKFNFPRKLEFFRTLYYEIKSHFVLEKIIYKVTGKCNKCGKCCRYMYSIDTYTENDFQFMQKLYPKYKRFKIVGKDELGNLIFGCNLVGKDGHCTDYKNRLAMCKYYPAKKLYFHGKLHDGCGYAIQPDKKFDDYLNCYTGMS